MAHALANQREAREKRNAKLAPENRDQIQNERQQNTHQDGRGEGEINRRMFSAKRNVPRQPAQWDVHAPEQNQDEAADDQQHPYGD